MPPTPSQIKELLLSAIDKDENIVDMGSVSKAVTLLESNPITKDALEETRLGRFIKIVRKKTTNSNLKKRCTALIKQWQSQFLPQNMVKHPKSESPAPSQDDVKGQEGSSTSEGQKSKPVKQTTNALSVDKTKSENQRRRKRETECSPSISPSSQGPPTKRLVSSPGQSTSLPGDRSGQCDPSVNGMSVKEDKDSGRTLIKDSIRTASPKTKVTSVLSKLSSNKDTGSLKKLKKDRSMSPKNGSKDIATNSLSPGSKRKQFHVSHIEDKLSPGTGSAKDYGRFPMSKCSSNDKPPRQSNNSSSSSSPSMRAQSSVLKTASIFVTDWDSTSFNAERSEVDISSSSTNQEPVSAPISSQSIFDLEFSENVQPEVLSTSVSDLGNMNSPPVSEEDLSIPAASGVLPSQFEFPRENIHSPKESEVVPKLPLQKMETLEDEPCTPPAPVLEEDIDRIHNDNWVGVNGYYNSRGEWSDWMQCLNVDIDEHSLQILPYVCID